MLLKVQYFEAPGQAHTNTRWERSCAVTATEHNFMRLGRDESFRGMVWDFWLTVMSPLHTTFVSESVKSALASTESEASRRTRKNPTTRRADKMVLPLRSLGYITLRVARYGVGMANKNTDYKGSKHNKRDLVVPWLECCHESSDNGGRGQALSGKSRNLRKIVVHP